MMFIKQISIFFLQKHDNDVRYCGQCENNKTARGKHASKNWKERKEYMIV